MLTEKDISRLDEDCAKALGWKLSDVNGQRMWVDPRIGVVYSKEDWRPTRNKMQAMSLALYFNMDIFTRGGNRVASIDVHDDEGCLQAVYSEEDPNLLVAICKVVVSRGSPDEN
jgi:hypothetical protein